MAPMWKTLMKDVLLDEPASFLDHVYFGCTPRECEPNEGIVERKKTCSNHVLLLEPPKTIPEWDKKSKSKNNSMVLRLGGTHRRMRGEILRIGKQEGRAMKQRFRVLAWIIITSKKKELESVGELSEVRSQIVLKTCFWARIFVGHTFNGQ